VLLPGLEGVAAPGGGCSNDARYSIYFQNRRVHFYVKDGSLNTATLSSANLLDDGEWHFVFGTFEPTNNRQTLYIDGCIGHIYIKVHLLSLSWYIRKWAIEFWTRFQ
jgi:hypothetical protein